VTWSAIISVASEEVLGMVSPLVRLSTKALARFAVFVERVIGSFVEVNKVVEKRSSM